MCLLYGKTDFVVVIKLRILRYGNGLLVRIFWKCRMLLETELLKLGLWRIVIIGADFLNQGSQRVLSP